MNSIIRQFYVEASMTGTEIEGIALQQTLKRLTHDRIIPTVATTVERCAPAESHWYFERLLIDVGAIACERLEIDLPRIIAESLERSLRHQTQSSSAGGSDDAGSMRIQSFPVALEQALLNFLAAGRLPWSFPLKAGQTLETAVLANWREGRSMLKNTVVERDTRQTDFNRAVIELLASSQVRSRLFSQFSGLFLEILLRRLSPGAASVLERVAETLPEVAASDRKKDTFIRLLLESLYEALAMHRAVQADRLVLKCWNDMKKSVPEWERRPWQDWLASHWLSDADDFGAAERDADRSAHANLDGQGADVRQPFSLLDRLKTSADAELSEGIFVANAGLVLLHPFLPQLFRALAIADGNRLLKPERALALLHYLATGLMPAPEYELVLPKLLCDIPLAMPVAMLKELLEDEIREVDALLEAVVRHWAALGDASIDSLRGTFLLRPGKVSRRRDGDWQVQVEYSSFDILLNRLPWGISMFQLPWMQSLCWVEWRYESEC